MVLKRAVLVAIAACMATHSAHAQRAGRQGRIGRGGDSPDGPRPFSGRGGPRQLLFGFALECVDCTWSMRPDAPVPVWHYTQYPRVAAVVPGGSAERAGVREGDLIRAMDGLSLLSDEGARRFSDVRPGDEIDVMVERNGKPIEYRLTLRIAGAMGKGAAKEAAAEAKVRGKFALPAVDRPRYTGRIGGSGVEVWGDDPVIVSVDSTGATVLRIGATTVRVQPSAPVAGLRGRRGLPPPRP